MKELWPILLLSILILGIFIIYKVVKKYFRN